MFSERTQEHHQCLLTGGLVLSCRGHTRYDCHGRAGGDACIVVLKGAGHLGYTVLGDEGTLGPERMFDLVRWYSAAFLRAFLAGDASCAQALADAPAKWNEGKDDHIAECRPPR
ncbi:MAG: hypothetical protein HY897_08350 [Deltaproteobacteria bacterium]|nr:hypothetical protein [Deltaproteobacteria bacterium]